MSRERHKREHGPDIIKLKVRDVFSRDAINSETNREKQRISYHLAYYQLMFSYQGGLLAEIIRYFRAGYKQKFRLRKHSMI